MRDDVVRAQTREQTRFSNGLIRYNAQMSSRQVREYCKLDRACQQMLRHSVEELKLSVLAHDKILRVSRTIADVGGDESIEEMHLAEAIGYRSLDRVTGHGSTMSGHSTNPALLVAASCCR